MNGSNSEFVPPQLRDLNEPFAEGAHPFGYSGAADDIDAWFCRLKCSCGATNAFNIKTGDSSLDGWISGEFGGDQRTDIRCAKCGQTIPFFDDGLHGYNAVICDDRRSLPAGYRERNASLLKDFICRCGHSTFSVFVLVRYDCGDLEGVPQSHYGDSYGSFYAVASCSRCRKTESIVDAETA